MRTGGASPSLVAAARASPFGSCRYLRESVAIEMRNPMKAFLDRARFINHNRNHFYEPLTVEEVDLLDPHKACNYFNDCFHNPAQFTVCVTGSIKVRCCHLPPTILPLPSRPPAQLTDRSLVARKRSSCRW